ncbi:hypothetical protein [Shinella zoogloeoides]|uniref:Uncharacterized protein n=1 Tax=Shinella zoogloeoides TaxID=352475 RepID=A0A6N8TFZ7_SHIZO|nr:hypothetical protein [Shinella zoogloeoides]MXO01335.1 hypothetical protein [Shinella zoogloeoides]UEX81568.1 hypothetical protein K8M09_18730 [Shinella zoogloeoides]
MHAHRQEAQAAAPFHDAMPHGDYAARAMGLVILLQGHAHTLEAGDRTRSRLMQLVSYWKLVLDICHIERERAAYVLPVPMAHDIDGDLIRRLKHNARSIAATLGACTFSDLTGLTLLLPARRTPAIQHLH